MLDILLPSLLLIALGAALHSVVKQASTRGHLKSELPIHRRSLSSSSPTSPWVIERHGLSVSVTTTGLNSLSAQIIDGRQSRMKEPLLLFYNVGTVAGVMGGIGAIGATIWQLVQIWGTVWLEVRTHAAEKGDAAGIVKRMLADVAGTSVAASAPALQRLQPLIPGVTLPLRHLPTLVLALIVNQLIHELGHALSAAVEDIVPSSFSLNLHGILFSMAVHLPPTVDYLPSRAKMRLATSGPFHNLVTYGWLWLLAFSGTGSLLWKDMSEAGRVVDAVSVSSPLYRHISPGRIITHLDDVPVAGPVDVWSLYLRGDIVGERDRGWCMNKVTFDGLSNSPCPSHSGMIAFEMTDTTVSSISKCLDPHPILYSPSIACPCPDMDDICVHPLDAERIMQIRLDDGSETGEMVLWQGDKTLVMRDIKVDKQGARFLDSIVRWATLFVEYLSTIALSLFLFNLLPLPHTDGSQLLKALLSSANTPSMFSLRSSRRSHPLTRSRLRSRHDRPMISIRHTAAQQYDLNSDSDDGLGYDVEDRGSRGPREEVWKKRFRRVVEGGSIALAIGWVAGWAMLALLRSS